jgi:NNP family nitrate/nitrite transporter-like MFS transporter
MLPLAIGLVVFLLVAKEAPRGPRQRVVDYLKAPREGDLRWLCLMYSVTFGGYVGLSSFLPLLFRDQYGLSPLDTGALTALGAFAGSAVRPLGGYLADHAGGARLLFVLLLAIGAVYALASHAPPVPIMAGLMAAGMACMGLGNGAVFQLVPRRFSAQVGTATGIVGAVGGLGGFLLPVLLGTTRQLSGGFELGLLALALLAFVALAALGLLVASRDGWRGSWRMAPAAGPAQPVPVRAAHGAPGRPAR